MVTLPRLLEGTRRAEREGHVRRRQRAEQEAEAVRQGSNQSRGCTARWTLHLPPVGLLFWTGNALTATATPPCRRRTNPTRPRLVYTREMLI